jgi:Ca2+:H+ antiporter
VAGAVGARVIEIGEPKPRSPIRRLRPVHALMGLLAALPVGVWAGRAGHPTLGFLASGVALVPLAYVIGLSTESLALRLGHGLGSIVLATLSNSVELLIGYLALQKGLPRVVQAEITGSILANILLVLGTAMFVGGVRHRSQAFGGKAANVQATLLFLAVLALFVPAFAPILVKNAPVDINRMSLVLSGGLLITYVLGLVFTLRTHRHLFEPGAESVAGAHARGHDHAPSVLQAPGTHTHTHEAAAVWPLRKALVVLAGATLLAAVAAETLTDTISDAARELGWTDLFVGAIVLAIVANAAEHWSAVSLAWKNRMNASIQVATASSIQIALFVAPALVFLSQGFAQPLSLAFPLLEVVAMGASVLVLNLVAYDGESNWFEGALLLMVYLILGTAFFLLP